MLTSFNVLPLLRKANKADGHAAFELLWSAREAIPLKDSFYSDANREWITDECRRKRVWVAEHGGRIVGLLYISGMELYYLVVGKCFRRTGIGRQLLAKGKRRHAWGKVNPNNHAVIALLESEGFVRDEEKLTATGWVAYNYKPKAAAVISASR
jgi:ribosomal protein S18 acetylase RimI-like enzyme